MNNFTGSQYNEGTFGDLKSNSLSANYIFGRNVTILGTAGMRDPDTYSSDNFFFQDSAVFDTNVNSDLLLATTSHPSPLQAGKSYDVKVTVYNFVKAEVIFESVALGNVRSATNYGEFTFNYVYTPAPYESFFKVGVKISGSNSNYQISLTERGSPVSPSPSPSPPGSAPPIGSLPDLVGSLISLKSDAVENGGAITLRYNLTNQGSAPTTNGNFDVYLSKDPTVTNSDYYLGTTGGLSLKIGETLVFENTTLPLPTDLAPGNYFVGVIADSSNIVSELIENNNVSTAALPVYVKPDLDQAAREIYRSMYAGDVSGSNREILESFADSQFEYGRKIGVNSPFVYANEAMGLALAEQARDGSTKFAQNYGPATLTSMELFTKKSYSDIFGKEAAPDQFDHLKKQLEYFENLYENSGEYGVDPARIELLARAAVFGQMVGIKQESSIDYFLI